MQVAPPKTKSPICFPLFRPGSIRRHSITISSLWISAVLLAVVQFAGCGITYNTLPLAVSPSSVAFGSVQVGQSQATTVTLQNQGLAAVTLSGMQAADPAFTLSSSQTNATIPAGGSATVKVTFTPTAVKQYSSQVMVASGNQQTTIPVSGAGQQSQQSAPPQSGTPALQLSSTTLQFGSVPIGGNAQQTLTLTSSGTAPLEIDTLNAKGSAFSAQAPTLPLTLQPGQSVPLPVKFGPQAAGSQTGQIVIGSNAAAASSVTVSLVGNGTTSAPTPPPTGPGTPALTLSSNSVNFGSIAVGSQATNSVTLTSSGSAAVVIQSIAVNGDDFSTGNVQLPLTLAPGQQIALPITFTPSGGGAAQGQITLTDNAAGSANSISLTGTGTTSASLTVPQSVDFGDVTVGSSGSKTVTLVSKGTAPVTITAITVTGGSFSGPPESLPQVLQPNQQISLKVKFSPTAEGDTTGSITVSSNSATNASAKIPMHGKGVPAPAPALSANATSLSFGQEAVGSQATQTVTVTSTGTAPATITGGSITGTGYSATYAGIAVQNMAAVTLQPGQQVTFDVVFDPTQTGNANGQLSLATDTGSPVNVSLSGKGTSAGAPALTLSASSLNLGDVQVGSNATQQLTLTSSGTAPVTISSAAIAGKDFQIASATYPPGITGWPATLQPGQQVVLSIAFAPDAVGSFDGNLALTSDATGGTQNVALSGTGDAVPAADLTLSATSINFGQAVIGSKVTRSLTLTSSGNAPLSISAITVSGAQFSANVPSLPVTLQPNQQLTLTLTFEPTADGSTSGTVTITSNDSSGPATVSLGGTGTTAPSPQLTVNPTAVNFGNVPVNTTVSKTVTLTSSGTAALTITAANATGSGFSVSGASFPLTLNPTQSATLQVQFDPSATGAASGQLTITSDANGNGTTQIPLSGTGTAVATPQLTVSAIALSFGSVTVNSSKTLPLTLTSSGTAAVTINAANIGGTGFSASGVNFPVTLNPNQSVTLNVQFAPQAAGDLTGQLTITSNSSSGATSVIQLSGTGTTAPSAQLTVNPTAVAFGNVTVNTSVSKTVTLTSSGTAALTITAASVTGSGFNVSGASFPLTLNPNQSATLQLQFDPGATGAASGQLTITSNANGNGTIQIPLSGTGTAATTPQLTVSASSLSFGNVAVNANKTLPVTLTSSGTASVTINSGNINGTGFSASGATFPVTLNPNQSVTLNVQFAPQAAGDLTGQLTITSNSSSGATTVVQLSGTGTVTTTVPTLQVSATSLPFGNVQVGATSTLTLTLTSTGTAAVTINSATITGTGFSDSGAAFPKTLNPNQSVTLNVQFDPTAAGAATGQLTISSNSSTGSTTQVQLSGTGTAVQHEIDLSWDAPASSSDPVAGYNIYRSTDGGSSFTKLNSSPDSQVSYTDSAVQSGTTYVYEVKSVDASGVESSASNQITLSVP